MLIQKDVKLKYGTVFGVEGLRALLIQKDVKQYRVQKIVSLV